MKKIVILKGRSVESSDDYILEKCLAIMFPECEIEIQFPQTVKKDGKEIPGKGKS